MNQAFLLMGMEYFIILCCFLACTFWRDIARILRRIAVRVMIFCKK
jgi:hypothetical protein